MARIVDSFVFTFSPFALFPFSPGAIGLGGWKLTDMVDHKKFRGTTILMVRRGDKVALAGDGQVTMGDMVMKHHAKKVRRLYHGKIMVGFAGSTADALTLFERLEAKLEKYQGNLTRPWLSWPRTGVPIKFFGGWKPCSSRWTAPQPFWCPAPGTSSSPTKASWPSAPAAPSPWPRPGP